MPTKKTNEEVFGKDHDLLIRIDEQIKLLWTFNNCRKFFTK